MYFHLVTVANIKVTLKHHTQHVQQSSEMTNQPEKIALIEQKVHHGTYLLHWALSPNWTLTNHVSLSKAPTQRVQHCPSECFILCEFSLWTLFFLFCFGKLNFFLWKFFMLEYHWVSVFFSLFKRKNQIYFIIVC